MHLVPVSVPMAEDTNNIVAPLQQNSASEPCKANESLFKGFKTSNTQRLSKSKNVLFDGLPSHLKSSSISNAPSPKNTKTDASRLSPLMIVVVLFSGVTGLLMGYDLCVIAVILKPITEEFVLCPHINPSSFCHSTTTVPTEVSYSDRGFADLNEIPYNHQLPRRLEVKGTNSKENDEEGSERKIPSFSWFPSSSLLSQTHFKNVFPCFASNQPFCALQTSNRFLNIEYQHEKDVDLLDTDFVDKETMTKAAIEAYKSCPLKQLFVSIISPGAALGSLMAGFIADIGGRKLTLGLSDVLILIGTFMMAFAHMLPVIVIGRFIVGLGVGTGFVIFSTYVSEISPEKRRGQLVSCQEIAQCIGCLTAYAVAAIRNNPNEWRVFLIGAGVVAALQICGILILPESPRWLIRHNKPADAEQALRRLSGLPKLHRKDNLKLSSCVSIKIRVDQNSQNNEDASLSELNHRNNLTEREKEIKNTLKKMIQEIENEKQSFPLHHNHLNRQNIKNQHLLCTSVPSFSFNKIDMVPNQNFKLPQQRSCPSLQQLLHLQQRQSFQSFISIDDSDDIPFSTTHRHHEHNNDNENNDYRQNENHNNNAMMLNTIDFPNKLITISMPELVSKNSVFTTTHVTENNDTNKTRQTKSSKLSYYYNSCILYSWIYHQCSLVFSFFHRYHRQLFIAIGCAACQNMTGSTAILYYSTEIFHLAGVENFLLAGTGIGLAKVAGILLVIVFVERVGRKRFLLCGSVGTLCSHIAFSAAFAMQGSKESQENNTNAVSIGIQAVSITAMILYMFFQNISWAGLMFVVASEILPSRARSIGMGLTITSFWILAFITQCTLETLMETLTIPGLFSLYAFLNVIVILFTWYYIPELSGKSLEEISETFH